MGKETICQLAKTVTGKMFEQQPIFNASNY